MHGVQGTLNGPMIAVNKSRGRAAKFNPHRIGQTITQLLTSTGYNPRQIRAIYDTLPKSQAMTYRFVDMLEGQPFEMPRRGGDDE